MDKQNAIGSGKRFLSRTEAAEYLGIGKRNLDAIAADGRVSCCRPSRRRVIFDIDDLTRYMVSTKSAPDA